MKPLNYLHINLSTGKIRPLPIKEGVVRAYLGGKTLAAKLLYDLLPKGVDPLSKENILIINTGIMTDTGAPSSSRFNMTFKNVMTGGIASSKLWYDDAARRSGRAYSGGRSRKTGISGNSGRRGDDS